MELKPYQQSVINDLAVYLSTLEKTPHLARAFKAFWADRGVTRMDAYRNNVSGVPHICAKVPTAGGKTYIAVNAIKTIFDTFIAHSPERAKLVVWLVPSLAILEQTVKNLSDPDHPYSKRLNQLFKGRVTVYEKRDMLLGAGFSADAVKEQLSIVVMSFDSLRARNKEDRKIFQDNGYLASFLTGAEAQDDDWRLPEYDASALINVIRRLKPVVVVDESHNAETSLSVEMLVNLNPHFILDLTATPKNNSNIISYVDAMALKRYHMVKLPVIVANRTSRSEVIESALILRRQLEEIAISEEKKGGKYIRPIVLFQAQPRIGDDNTTFEKIKEKLVELQIPAEQIKIKTASLNELKGVDLMSRNCPVRYIITVNALKEGWDCPFAYVLASLADKSSAVDVEQILGRVLRMPHVQQHGHDLLNLSYVFTASSRFMDTIQSVVRALNRAGFSDNDYRTFNAVHPIEKADTDNGQVAFDLGGIQLEQTKDEYEIDTSAVSPDWSTVAAAEVGVPSPISETIAFVEAVKAQAVTQNREFEARAEAAADSDVPADLEDKMNKHKLKEIFHDDALVLKLPQFFIRVATGGWFDDDNALQLFERDELLKEFKLSQADGNINFEDVATEMYRVDLEQLGDHNYAPKPFKINATERERFNSIILKGARDSQVRDITARLVHLVGNLYPITDPEVKKYIQRIVETWSPEQIRDCLERDVAYVRKIKQKITALANAHATKEFNDLLDVDKIVVQPQFSFPDMIAPSANAPALPKSLYGTEASMGAFEGRVINDIANLESIQWWHRNLSRGKGFRINGFLNHYPDFILKTKTGKIVVLETKGDDRDNTDSELKLKLGKLWESKSGGSFKYMMVFDNNPINGAERLADALKKLAQF
ncbi:DEAD/DEAH box helicase [Paraherbaspirillum soli]|uniref:DEAD/DEAH box helicase n=1 Tax=Paraherbaspirillum soli TaxID=631222 RepID=A0ABW0M8L7_9BURK